MIQHNGKQWTPVEKVLARLDDATKNGAGWMATCPGCGAYSYHVREESDGGAGAYCDNGCDGDEMLYERLGQ